MVTRRPSPPRAPRGRRSAGRRSAGRRSAGRHHDGFNLVILAVSVTVLNILLAMALPAWSTMIRREKEKELIFRGLQYAEAVRVFKLPPPFGQGRLPNRITELTEVKPRAIRQLWKNPMAEDGSWLLLPAQGQLNPRGGATPAGVSSNNRPEDGRGRGNNQRRQQGRPTQIRVVPPSPGETLLTPMPNMPGGFIGVASPEGDEALLTFKGSNEVRDWQFVWMDLSVEGMGVGQAQERRPANAGMFWKPFPPGVVPPALNVQGQGQDLGGGQPRRPPPRNKPRRN